MRWYWENLRGLAGDQQCTRRRCQSVFYWIWIMKRLWGYSHWPGLYTHTTRMFTSQWEILRPTCYVILWLVSRWIAPQVGFTVLIVTFRQDALPLIWWQKGRYSDVFQLIFWWKPPELIFFDVLWLSAAIDAVYALRIELEVPRIQTSALWPDTGVLCNMIAPVCLHKWLVARSQPGSIISSDKSLGRPCRQPCAGRSLWLASTLASQRTERNYIILYIFIVKTP